MPHTLFFAVHNHQPVGNFDSVIDDAFEKGYLPFLRLVRQFPDFKFALHNSGILYEWAEKRKPEFFELIEELLEQRQIELLGGGFYEPILPSIPEADRLGQILKMSDYLEKRFGQRPIGTWIAERVWEPNLPKTLFRAGIEYTMLDDTHFRYAGYNGPLTSGPLLTEDEGRAVYVFPILKELRYKVPFGTIEEIKNRLFENLNEDKCWVYADDGEKFGVWPKTYEHCYINGWLEKFLEAVTSDGNRLQVRFFSEALKNGGSVDRVYLPPASYEEMLEWALPPQLQLDYETVKEKLKSIGEWEKAAPFLRGGFWRNFLSKYPEVNHMHKKMLLVSHKLQGLKDSPQKNKTKLEEARNLLYKGQCNCPYWHGVFGGAYLTHLRAANYEALIGAQNLIYELDGKAQISVEEIDFDADGHKEVVVETSDLFCVINPHKGGSISELDFKAKQFNLQNTFAGRLEAYHLKLSESTRSSEQIATIHARIEIKDKNLAEYLPSTDKPVYPKWSFYDTLDEVTGYRVAFQSEIKKEAKKAVVSLETENFAGFSLQKTISFEVDQPRIKFDYQLKNLQAKQMPFTWTSEFSFNFEAPYSPDRYFKINGKKSVHPTLEAEEKVADVNSVELVDEWRKLAAVFRFSIPIRFQRIPIFTVSLSESGVEKTYQGSTLLFGFPLNLKPNEASVFEFSLELLSL